VSLLPGDLVRRQAATWLIAATAATTPIDVIEVLTADPNVAIRAEATIALLKSGSSDQRATDALRNVLTQPGCYVAESVVNHMISPLEQSALVDTAVAILVQHPSARVRALARRAALM
jgi:metal-sulfur cluster biosynthetic enzyme